MKLGYQILFLLLSLSSCHAVAGICEEFLLKGVLYSHGQDNPHAHEFYASNEFDWQKEEPDFEPVDLLVGVANNVAWDRVVRKNIGELILLDDHSSTLKTNAFIYRTFFKLARTRTEFLSLVAGVRFPPETGDLTAKELIARTFSELENSSIGSRISYRQEVVARIRGTLDLAPETAEIVEKYYQVQLHGDLDGGSGDFGDPSLFPFPVSSPDRFVDLYVMFVTRYYPGASQEYMNDNDYSQNPMATFMASNRAYAHARYIFVNNHIQYVHADVQNPEVYKVAAKLMRERGLKSIAIATSNIFDANYLSNEAYIEFVRKTVSVLQAEGVQFPIYFYQTRNGRPPHAFERHVIHSPADIEKMQFKFKMDMRSELLKAIFSFR